MTDDHMTGRDEIGDDAIERIASALRPLPEVDPSAKARVLVALAAERAHPERATRADREERQTRYAMIGGLAVGTVAAGLIAAAVLLRAPAEAVERAPVAPAPTAAPTLASAASADANAPVLVQLVLHAPTAARVSVVGDFTGWEQDRVAMTRDAASGLWSATVAVRPGRHVYAFVADDTVWMRDPRAPLATDADFGRPGSLLLVGRP